MTALREKIDVLMCCEQAKVKARLHGAENLLRVLGPQAPLERGYSITTDEPGNVVRQVSMATSGQRIITRVSDGELPPTVD